jgi:hypothetical protein
VAQAAAAAVQPVERGLVELQLVAKDFLEVSAAVIVKLAAAVVVLLKQVLEITVQAMEELAQISILLGLLQHLLV